MPAACQLVPGTEGGKLKQRIVRNVFAVSHSPVTSAVDSPHRYVWRSDVKRKTGVAKGRRTSRDGPTQLNLLHHFRLTFRRGSRFNIPRIPMNSARMIKANELMKENRIKTFEISVWNIVLIIILRGKKTTHCTETVLIV